MIARFLAAALTATLMTTSAQALDLGERQRVTQFFRALDTVADDEGSDFLRVDELDRVAFDATRRIDIHLVRAPDDATLETRRIADDLRLRRIAVRSGDCAAARYFVDPGPDAVETLRAARADARVVARAVPAGTALAFEDVMRTCSGTFCRHDLADSRAETVMNRLFTGNASVAVADMMPTIPARPPGRTARPENPRPTEPANPFAPGASTRPGKSDQQAVSTDDLPDRLLSDDGGAFCQDGAIVDPR